MRLFFVKVELAPVMTIERLVRDVVAADKDVAAEMHFGSRRKGEHAAGGDEGSQMLSGHSQSLHETYSSFEFFKSSTKIAAGPGFRSLTLPPPRFSAMNSTTV